MSYFDPQSRSFSIAKRNKRRLIVPFVEPRRREDYEDEKICCTLKAECKGCNIATHGFLCFSANGSCLRNAYKKPKPATT